MNVKDDLVFSHKVDRLLCCSKKERKKIGKDEDREGEEDVMIKRR